MCANLAEAWRKRRYQAAFISKLNDVEGEAAKSQVHIEIAFRHSYLGEEVFDELDDAYDKVIGQIVKMIDRPDRWNNQISKKRLTWKRSYSDETPFRPIAVSPIRVSPFRSSHPSPTRPSPLRRLAVCHKLFL